MQLDFYAVTTMNALVLLNNIDNHAFWGLGGEMCIYNIHGIDMI